MLSRIHVIQAELRKAEIVVGGIVLRCSGNYAPQDGGCTAEIPGTVFLHSLGYPVLNYPRPIALGIRID